MLVHYTGTLDDGTVFDSSSEREPLGFTVGSGQMISGFDAAVNGMALGETVTVRIESADAYGEWTGELLVDVPIAQVPAGVAVGDSLASPAGTVVVTAVTESTVTIDANHPLAGQALTFEIELVEIR